MKPANVFQLEIASALASRRSLLMRLALPLLLALPFAIVAMPPRMKASGLVMLLLFLTFFGSAVTKVRRRSEGHLARLSVLPIPAWLVQLDMLLASAVIDLLQMAGVFGLYLAANAKSLSAGEAMTLAGLLCVVVLGLNLLGMLLAGAVKNNPEVHLFGALTVGLIGLMSGLFPTPQRIEPVVSVTAAWNPVAFLARELAMVADTTHTADAGNNPVVMVTAGLALAVTVGAVILRSLPTTARRSRARKQTNE